MDLIDILIYKKMSLKMRTTSIVFKIYIKASALNYNIIFKINNRSIYSNFKNSIIKRNIVRVKCNVVRLRGEDMCL